MHRTLLSILVGALSAAMMSPAMAAWHGYIGHPMGFAFAAPGELKLQKGTYRGDVAGTRDTIIYRFVDDDIEYKVVVIDMRDIENDAANLLGEAAYPIDAKGETLTGVLIKPVLDDP
jgi:hypothetical protein